MVQKYDPDLFYLAFGQDETLADLEIVVFVLPAQTRSVAASTFFPWPLFAAESRKVLSKSRGAELLLSTAAKES